MSVLLSSSCSLAHWQDLAWPMVVGFRRPIVHHSQVFLSAGCWLGTGPVKLQLSTGTLAGPRLADGWRFENVKLHFPQYLMIREPLQVCVWPIL